MHVVIPNTLSHQVEGSLRFCICYDQRQSQLLVTVLRVEGLLPHTQNHSPQPFVKLTLLWAGSVAVEVEGCTNEEVASQLLIKDQHVGKNRQHFSFFPLLCFLTGSLREEGRPLSCGKCCRSGRPGL